MQTSISHTSAGGWLSSAKVQKLCSVRVPIADCRATLSELSTSGRSAYAVHVDIPQRPVLAPPKPVPVKHSLTFLEQRIRASDVVEVQQSQKQEQAAAVPESFKGNAIEWALRKADQKLNELEANPQPLQQAVFEVSRGPMGQAATQGVEVAAKITVQATMMAAKAAAPVGKWALKEGVKAAAGLIQAAIVEGAKKKK